MIYSIYILVQEFLFTLRSQRHSMFSPKKVKVLVELHFEEVWEPGMVNQEGLSLFHRRQMPKVLYLHGLRPKAEAERVVLTSRTVSCRWGFAKSHWLIETMASIAFCSVAGGGCLGVAEHWRGYNSTGREEVERQGTDKMIISSSWT